MPINSPQSACLANPISNLYLVNLNAVSRTSTITIYISPTCSCFSAFFSELQDELSYMASLPHDLVLMGDFTFTLNPRHRMLIGSLVVWSILSLYLESFDLNQYVSFPTRIHGYSLDLTICSKGCDVLSVSPSDVLSGHFSVIAHLKIPTDHSHTVPQSITYRKSWRSLILKPLRLISIRHEIRHDTTLTRQYDSFLSIPIDLHAALVTKTISPKPPNQWMTHNAILASKRHRRYFEDVWRRYPL